MNLSEVVLLDFETRSQADPCPEPVSLCRDCVRKAVAWFAKHPRSIAEVRARQEQRAAVLTNAHARPAQWRAWRGAGG